MSKISVIIVNYLAADLAIEAVESVLERDHGGRNVEVHLLDNASPGGSDAAILGRKCEELDVPARLTFHPETINHGFGRGNNLIVERLAPSSDLVDYVLLLNPDARLKNETVDILASFLDENPNVAVAGARIEKPDTGPVTAAFRFPGIVSTFAGALAFGPVSRLTSRWRVALPPETPTGRVDWVAGAAVMIRLSAFRAVGGFDPDYFLYYEEVDLMRRLGVEGWETWHVAEAEAIHAEGVSTGVKSGETARRRRPAYWYESWRLYFIKNHGRAYASVAALSWLAGAALNHAIARARGKQPAAPLRFFGDFWAMAARPILGLEAKPYE
ncbi:MAG: glycosyltransferase family 2 protein [Pseudomonadota bacterium]